MENLIISFLIRHQDPINLVLHIIGIPLVIAGIFQLFIKRWKAAFVNIFIGYLIQYAGHLFFEHNQMGEWALIVSFIGRITG